MKALFSGTILFCKFWGFQSPPNYQQTVLPGNIPGISGSTIGGMNVGINNYISEEKIKAAVKAVQHMTSIEVQRKKLIEDKDLSFIISLYDDEEICQIVDCEIMKNLQFIPRPSSLTNNYDDYSFRFRNYIYEFLYEGKDASYTLKKIDDIVKIYNISFNLLDSKEGFIILILTMILTVIIITSLAFLFIEKYKRYFNFFKIDCWMIIIMGFIINLSNIFTYYGKVIVLKCQLRIILNNFGFSFITIPILYKLIANFYVKYKVFVWIEINKYKFFLIFSLFDFLTSALTFIPTHDIKTINIKDGNNFQLCSINPFGKMLLLFICIEKIFIILMIFLMIFLEWNIVKMKRDIKIITSAFNINYLTVIMLIILKFININNYKIYFIMYSTIVLIFVFSFYFFIYGMRIIHLFFKKDNGSKKNHNITSISKNNESVNYETSNKTRSINHKFLQYHYFTGEEDIYRETVNPSSNTMPSFALSNADTPI